MATLKYLSQYFSTTLNVGGGIDDSQTTGIILQSVSGVTDITKPGQICITYSDPIDTSVAEWIDYTSINGSNELVGAVRGREGFSAHAHLQGATVAFVMSASHHNDVVDLLNGTEAGIKVKTAIYDENGNEVIKTPATTSAVNEVTVTNSATGNAVQVSATGGDTDISLNLVSKGSGTVQMNGTPIISSSTDGWVSAGETWTYASASTFTIAGVDLTTKYTKGTRLKFTQTTVKYAVVVSSSFSTNTTVTIAVNTDYTIANAAISANYYSYQASPAGYPVAFAVTVTNGLECKLSIIGQEATLYGWSYLLQAGGGSTTVEKTITYGFTFASLPMVIAQNVGVKYTSAPTTISDLTTSVTGDGLYKSFAVHAITTTTFKSIAGQTGSAGADTYRAFSWIAKGNI